MFYTSERSTKIAVATYATRAHGWPDGTTNDRARIAKAHEDYLRGIFHFLRTDPHGLKTCERRRLVSACRRMSSPTTAQRGLLHSDHVQVSRVGSEGVSFDSKVLQHGHEQIAERLVVLAVEGEVLAVAEAAAGQQDGKIGGVVDVCVPEIAAVENHGVVQ